MDEALNLMIVQTCAVERRSVCAAGQDTLIVGLQHLRAEIPFVHFREDFSRNARME
jgi:hypothetical protein